MSLALATRRSASADSHERRRAGRCHTLAGGRLTLDELISGAWAAVAAHAPVACPWCGGRMDPVAAGHAGCRSCASRLS